MEVVDVVHHAGANQVFIIRIMSTHANRVVQFNLTQFFYSTNDIVIIKYETDSKEKSINSIINHYHCIYGMHEKGQQL